MSARRSIFAAVALLCALGLILGTGVGAARAAGGSFQFGPIGVEAGQIDKSFGMAVGEGGDIYLSDTDNERIDEFDQSGGFLRAWGWGVIPPAAGQQRAEELQVCTNATGCGEGTYGSGAGQFDSQNAAGVAVDDDPLSGSHGDVYVVDDGNYRVEKFSSEGKFLLMFGGHVNKTAGGNVCVVGEACGAGTEGAGNGEFNWRSQEANIAVGPDGDVYVGDRARVEVFEPSGVWKENISLSALSSEGKVSAIAVSAAGDVFVKDEGVPGVREFEPGGGEAAAKFDAGSESVAGIALDAAGDVFISENEGNSSQSCNCDFREYSPSGQELESFGGHTLTYLTSSMAFDEAAGELLVYGSDTETSGYGHFGVWGFPAPPPGPLVEPGSERATPELRGAATLEALVNPEGSSTEVKFEYVDEADFKAGGYASATSTSAESIGSSFEDQHVVVHLPQKALVPSATYHWRVVAHNANGTNPGPDQNISETAPAETEGPWATHVTSTSATLAAEIDPLGASTSYRLEYGSSTAYGHVFAGSVGEGMGYAPIASQVQGLEPSATYHYRLVTESEVGTVQGADRTFTTQPASGELALPDGRAWELVSPPNKGGALIEDVEHVQAASDGSGIVYAASEPIGEDIVGHVGNNGEAIASATELSTRGPDGWRTRDISPTESILPEGEQALNLLTNAEAFMTFTPDLSLGVMEGRGLKSPQSEEATEPTLYVRNDTSGTYEPLVTQANVPAGTRWAPDKLEHAYEDMSFQAATPDLGHILFADWAALTPEAFTEKGQSRAYAVNLYEWSGGQLQLVNILPDGKPKLGAAFGTGAEGEGGYPNPWAMSADGRWIVFRYGQLGAGDNWYVRDMVERRTVPFGRPGGKTKFETMSRDGSRLFYLEPESGEEQEGELYVFDPESGTTTDLTAKHLEGERSADVQNMLVGIGEGGSYVYFVAKGVLASGATRGQDNLYVMHDDGGEWQTTFIGTLSREDSHDWRREVNGSSEVKNITSRVTPNGRYLAFMSDRSLTGYDNRDARSGQPDEEVYLYDAETNRLVCASCNPSGARPFGIFDRSGSGTGGELLMDQSGAWSGEGGHWLAADIALEWNTDLGVAFHQAVDLSNGGRLFFNSSDALVPQDTNGVADVYEYEPAGVGSCTSADATFSTSTGGCVSLISSGQSAAESTFLDASEGGDAFFLTAARLTSEDRDTAYDVYDAHICAEAKPCRAEPVAPPECTSGDSCKAAPSLQPELFGAPPSETFNGAGNVAVQPQPSATPKSCAKGAVGKRGECVKKKSKKRRKTRRARKSTAGPRRAEGAKR
ncbi:MAG TPA: hypothetical protein VNY52_03605 [Solirubrobacteraceae bacterium]|jgi:hypothetical protein|nr:hypothetical protein [Solirubrobacteraceae bacterium]